MLVQKPNHPKHINVMLLGKGSESQKVQKLQHIDGEPSVSPLSFLNQTRFTAAMKPTKDQEKMKELELKSQLKKLEKKVKKLQKKYRKKFTKAELKLVELKAIQHALQREMSSKESPEASTEEGNEEAAAQQAFLWCDWKCS